MPYGIKFVPLSPGVDVRPRKADFPDLHTPLSDETLMRVKKDIEDFAASPLFEYMGHEFYFESATSPEVISTPMPASNDYFWHDELQNQFDFLMQNDDSESDTSSSSDILSDPNVDFNGTADEDNSFGLLPEAMLESETESSDLAPDLVSLVSSIDLQQMDQETLDSLQKSLEELEAMFDDTPMVALDA